MKPLDKANDFLQNSGKYFEWEKLKLVHDLKSQVEEMQKVLTIVRDTLEHKKNEDRTSWSLWNEANKTIQSIQGGKEE